MANIKPNTSGLTPFKKGVSGNPKGRAKKLPELDVLLADMLGTEDSGNSEAKEVITSLLKQAKKGNVRAIEVLLERAYGKPKQVIDNNINMVKPLIIDWGDSDATNPE